MQVAELFVGQELATAVCLFLQSVCEGQEVLPLAAQNARATFRRQIQVGDFVKIGLGQWHRPLQAAIGATGTVKADSPGALYLRGCLHWILRRIFLNYIVLDLSYN